MSGQRCHLCGKRFCLGHGEIDQEEATDQEVFRSKADREFTHGKQWEKLAELSTPDSSEHGRRYTIAGEFFARAAALYELGGSPSSAEHAVRKAQRMAEHATR